MTASMSWERRSSAAIACSSGTSPSLRPPFESYSKARLDSSPTRPCSWCSSPIGRYSGGQPLPNVAWIDSGVGGGQRRAHVADEIGVPGGVEQVDLVAVVLDRRHGQRGGDVLAVLLRLEVGHGGPVLHAADPVDRTGRVQERLDQ